LEKLIPEADLAEGNISNESKTEKKQTMMFHDSSGADREYAVVSAMDKTRLTRTDDEASLGEFLSRPILIDETTWAVNANAHLEFDPWFLFFTNARVSNRISNFNLLRCTLKVKMLINGNPFYYGRAIASYLPVDTWDDFSRSRSTVPQDVIQMSQQPHVWLDPTTSTGGTLTLPFFHYYDFINITDGTWTTMGNITIKSVNELAHANGGTDPITISTFAWAEDVVLAVPTSVNADLLSPQADLGSSDETDQANSKGVISGPATAVAGMMNGAKKLPSLSPYASAIEMAAKMTASTAKLLGYSRPTVTRDPDAYQPIASSSLAVCTVPDNVGKLTVDDKQALGMGSELAGIQSEDPLSILSIAQRESYLTTFLWDETALPNAFLWNMRLNPTFHDESNTGVAPETHMTAIGVASVPFEYWTGSIKIRFQVVASAYHRGRLRFVYDPNYLEASPEFNVNHQEVIDISEQQDITFTISNSQERGILKTLDPFDNAPSTYFSTTRFTTFEESNGVIGVYVQNQLATPANSLQPIQINVFVSAGDDFKVFSPIDRMDRWRLTPEADLGIEGGMNVDSSNDPVAEDSHYINSDVEAIPEMTRVYCGEEISSFRQLLKRYHYFGLLTDTLNESNYSVYARRQSFPYLPGNVTGAVDVTGVGGNYNYCNFLLLHWVTTCFQGWRGSIRHKIVPTFDARNTAAYIQRTTGSTTYSNSVIAATAPTGISAARRDGLEKTTNCIAAMSGAAGQHLAHSYVNPVITAEVPFQRDFRFGATKVENRTTGDPWEGGFEYSCSGITLTTSHCPFQWHVAAGEDFQVYFWTGMPPLYKATTIPAA
jgi:hypothetical protein